METFGETFGRNHFRHRGKGSGGGGGNQGGGKGGGGGRNRNNRRKGGGGKGGGGGGYGGGAAAVKDNRIDNLSHRSMTKFADSDYVIRIDQKYRIAEGLDYFSLR